MCFIPESSRGSCNIPARFPKNTLKCDTHLDIFVVACGDDIVEAVVLEVVRAPVARHVERGIGSYGQDLRHLKAVMRSVRTV